MENHYQLDKIKELIYENDLSRSIEIIHDDELSDYLEEADDYQEMYEKWLEENQQINKSTKK